MKQWTTLIRTALAILLSLAVSGCGLIEKPQIRALALSPDGNQLALSYKCVGQPMRIGLVDLASRTLIRTIAGTQGRYAAAPSFSNDGRLIVVASGRPDELANGIFIIDLRTGAMEEVVSSEMPNGFPRFSPDDRRIGFVRAGRIRPKNAALPVTDIDAFEIDLESRLVKQVTHQSYYAVSGIDYLSDSEILITGVTRSDAIIAHLDRYGFRRVKLGESVSNIRAARALGAIYFIARANIGIPGRLDYEVFSKVGDTISQVTDLKSYITALSVSNDGQIIAFKSDKERNDDYVTVVMNLETRTHFTLDRDIFMKCGDEFTDVPPSRHIAIQAG